MIVYPNAKINIGLNVVEKRPDGYHDLETVFYPIGLQDILEIQEIEADAPECGYRLKVTGTVLDGSHNPDGMKALSAFLGTFKGRTVRAVIGMHTDKDAGEAVKMLVPQVTEFYPVSGFSDRDIPAGELAGIISKAGGKALLRDGEIISLVSALSEEFPGDVLLICGSLYLVSYIKTAKNQQ